MQQLILYFFIAFNSIYNYSVPSLNGNNINFSDFSGKKVLIVNVASQSVYNFQLAKLDSLQQQYKDSLVVVVIPSNSFGHEPMDSIQLYNAMNTFHFKVATKAEVEGQNQILLYKWISNIEENGIFDNKVKDDFQKYLVDETGRLIGVFSPMVDPLSSELTNALKIN